MKDVVGKQIGKLKILEDESVFKEGNKNPYRYLTCLCECGSIFTTRKGNVLSGYTKSCPVCSKERQRKSVSKTCGESSFNTVFSKYKQNAERRGHSFELTKEEFKNLITQPCIYCGKVLGNVKRGNNGNFCYTGLDRKDNSKGYTLENVVPCCLFCNREKNALTLEEFAEKIDKILKNSNNWLKIVK